ncbi:peptidyl-prolyl cis-trans isomerase, cyclophilin-type, partial [Oesophagostomum dentatum]
LVVTFRSCAIALQTAISCSNRTSDFPRLSNTIFHFIVKSGSDVMAVTLHTTVGDIKIELFCQECPKTCENFLALCASDYYKNNIFHRNIKDFMVQTGDPTGTGKGGNSIWGAPFEDELSVELRHDGRGTVSMANNGPNTNKSQFFITYAKQPHLDLKYTVFGKVIDGFDALDELETIKVDAKYRPVVEQR